MKCVFFGISWPRLGVPWENRGRRATPNSIVSLWPVSRNCCMEWCALYFGGVGLHRDRFQSLRLLKISGRWRPSVMREHFTQEWVRVRSFGVMGLTNRPRDEIPNYYGKVSVCLRRLFVWKSSALDWMFLLEPLDPQRQPPRNKAGRITSIWPARAGWVRCLDLSLPSLI